jgi:ferritin-like metal-binding protein YciE
MFEKLETPNDVFTFKLGAALKMERTVLEMLGKLQEETRSEELRQQFSHHADETEEQIENLERSFAALGAEIDDSPCPAIEGIDKEGKANIKKASDEVVDAVILSGAAETEHHEIAVYEGLITHAQAMGQNEVVRLLSANLEQEQHTLEEVKQATEKLARTETAHAP